MQEGVIHSSSGPVLQVIVVDDEPDIVFIIKKSLQAKYRYLRVDSFTNPRMALEYFRQNYAKGREINHDGDDNSNFSKAAAPPPTIVVISDVRMPGISGFDLAKAVKQLNQDAKVFLMTAFEIDRQEFSKALFPAKIEGYLQKPVTAKQLAALIQQHVNSHGENKRGEEAGK